MSRPNCKKCDTPLTGAVRYHVTTCPGCGKHWRLNADNSAIHSITLDVHSVEHVQKTVIPSEVKNG
jgi:hypothetical protein